MSKIRNKIFRNHLRSKNYLHPYCRPPKNEDPILKTPTVQDDPEEIKTSITDILSQLSQKLPSERTFGTDMIVSNVTKERASLIEPQQMKELLDNLSILVVDRAENVRSGAIDALWHLSTLGNSVQELMFKSGTLETILNFLHQYLVPLNLETIGSKNKKVSTLAIFVDAFDLLSTICDNVPASIKAILDSKEKQMKLNQIFLKCFQSTSQLDSDKLNLIVASVQFLTIILDEMGPEILLHLDLNTSLEDLNTKLDRELDSASGSLMIQIVYLKCLLISMYGDGNPSNSSVQILCKISHLIPKLFSIQTAGTLETFSLKIQEEMASEMKSLLELYPIYLELKYYFLGKRFIFECLTNVTSMNEDEELMTSIGEHSLQRFFSENSILSTVLNESSFDLDCSPLSKHLYGKEILDLFTDCKVTSLALLHNLIGVLELDQSEMDKTWDVVYHCWQRDCNRMDEDNSIVFQNDFQVQKEAINIIRQFYYKSESIRMNIRDLLALKTLWSDDRSDSSLKINITKIISCHLRKIFEANQCETNVIEISNWIEFLLNHFHSQPTEDGVLLNCEIFDSIIDLLSDEVCARESIRILPDMEKMLKQCGQQLRQQVISLDHQEYLHKNPVVETVIENMYPFLDYLKNIQK